MNSKVLVDRELDCSGLDHPPGFEGYIGVVRPSSQRQVNKALDGLDRESFFTKGEETDWTRRDS